MRDDKGECEESQVLYIIETVRKEFPHGRNNRETGMSLKGKGEG